MTDYADEDLEDERERLARETRQAQVNEDDDMRLILKTVSGRRALWRMLQEGGYRPGHQMAATYVIGDALASAHAAGEISVGLRQMMMMTRADPDLVDTMIKENGR